MASSPFPRRAGFVATPDESRIVPWGVQSIDNEDIDFWQDRLSDDIVDTATSALVDELR
jgi:hypothetical protein